MGPGRGLAWGCSPSQPDRGQLLPGSPTMPPPPLSYLPHTNMHSLPTGSQFPPTSSTRWYTYIHLQRKGRGLASLCLRGRLCGISVDLTGYEGWRSGARNAANERRVYLRMCAGSQASHTEHHSVKVSFLKVIDWNSVRSKKMHLSMYASVNSWFLQLL